MIGKEYYLKDRYPDMYPLSEEEISSGWHFCPEWDYMLIGPGMDEMDACLCFEKIKGL